MIITLSYALHQTSQCCRSIFSVGVATGYGLDDQMIGVRFLAGAGNFFLRHRVRTCSGTHPASYPMGTESSFPAGKAAGREADHSPPSSPEVKEYVEIYLHSPLRLHGMVLSTFTVGLYYTAMLWCIVDL
jgi:hypothetical protein